MEWLLVFKALWVGPQVHQSTNWTPPTRGPSTGAIWKNSLFLGLYELVNKCTGPPYKHLPRSTSWGLTNERPWTEHVIWWSMRGLAKKSHGRGTNGRTSQLLDRISPVGQFGEKNYVSPFRSALPVRSRIKTSLILVSPCDTVCFLIMSCLINE